MKIINIYFWLIVYIILFVSCITQQISIDAKRKSFIIYKTTDNLKIHTSKIEYIGNNFHLSSRGWKGVDIPIIKSKFEFTKQKDTMKLFCFCRELNNYYFKDLKFKKGEYFINLPYEINWIKGLEIKTNRSFQNIKFKRTYLVNHTKKTSSIEDLFFEDLFFQIIDFSDTKNIKLEPVNEEEFWHNNFLPRSKK